MASTMGVVNNAIGGLVTLKVTQASLKMISSSMKSSGKGKIKYNKIKW